MNFGCGVVAGIMASLATQPADVVKTSIQISQSHCSMMKVVRHIYTVSLAGFWTGVQEPGRNVCSHTVSSLSPCPLSSLPLLLLSSHLHRSKGWEVSSVERSPGACAVL